MKSIIIFLFLFLRIIENEGVILEKRRPKPRTQPPEIRIAIKRPWKKGSNKKTYFD